MARSRCNLALSRRFDPVRQRRDNSHDQIKIELQ